jgi:ABC-2 type transport system permease protein
MQVFAIALQDLRLLFAERGAAVLRLLMPVAFIFVVGLANDAFAPDAPPLPVLAVVDHDESALSAFYASIVADRLDGVEICGVTTACRYSPSGGSDERSRTDLLLEAGAADYALVIPAGFERDLRDRRMPRVELVFARSDPEQASRIAPVLDAAGTRASLAASAGDAARDLVEDPEVAEAAADAAVARALELLVVDRTDISISSIELPETYPLDGFRQSVPGMGSMFVMMSVLAGAAMLVEERKRWTLQRTLIAPVTSTAYVAGKVLGRFLIGMAQYSVAIATGLVLGIVFGISFGRSPLLLVTVMSAFVLCVSGISVLLATLVSREQHAASLNTLLAVTLAPIGGAWWSLDMEIVPDVMSRVAVISPFYWVIEGFRAAIYDLGFGAAAPSLTILSLVGIVTAAIAALRLRRI